MCMSHDLQVPLAQTHKFNLHRQNAIFLPILNKRFVCPTGACSLPLLRTWVNCHPKEEGMSTQSGSWCFSKHSITYCRGGYILQLQRYYGNLENKITGIKFYRSKYPIYFFFCCLMLGFRFFTVHFNLIRMVAFPWTSKSNTLQQSMGTSQLSWAVKMLQCLCWNLWCWSL